MHILSNFTPKSMGLFLPLLDTRVWEIEGEWCSHEHAQDPVLK